MVVLECGKVLMINSLGIRLVGMVRHMDSRRKSQNVDEIDYYLDQFDFLSTNELLLTHSADLGGYPE